MWGAQSSSNLGCVQMLGEGAQGLCCRGRTDGSAGLLWDEGCSVTLGPTACLHSGCTAPPAAASPGAMLKSRLFLIKEATPCAPSRQP